MTTLNSTPHLHPLSPRYDNAQAILDGVIAVLTMLNGSIPKNISAETLSDIMVMLPVILRGIHVEGER